MGVDGQMHEPAPEVDGRRFSVRSFAAGTKFVHVDVDQGKFDGLTPDEQMLKAREVINQRFRGTTIGVDLNNAYVDQDSAREFESPATPLPDELKGPKARTSPELNELSKIPRHHADSRSDSRHHRKTRRPTRSIRSRAKSRWQHPSGASRPAFNLNRPTEVKRKDRGDCRSPQRPTTDELSEATAPVRRGGRRVPWNRQVAEGAERRGHASDRTPMGAGADAGVQGVVRRLGERSGEREQGRGACSPRPA